VFNPDKLKGTGRTTRMLQAAHEAAQGGRRVIVVGMNAKHADMLFEQSLKMELFGDIRFVSYESIKRELDSYGKLRGRREDEVFFDHAVFENYLSIPNRDPNV
jgi:hypothetical protein